MSCLALLGVSERLGVKDVVLLSCHERSWLAGVAAKAYLRLDLV